jgi:hypothetical protein
MEKAQIIKKRGLTVSIITLKRLNFLKKEIPFPYSIKKERQSKYYSVLGIY